MMEDRLEKRGKVARSASGGFYIVAEDGKKTGVDRETVSVWSMFNGKTVDEVADLMVGGGDPDSRKHFASMVGDLEKAGLLARF